ncbi:hypothetical protein C9374_002320 [Naegleria lovaniensis]|uniref:N-acetyltransferase domain-containing protein n=1 Tax=Naegleria lovaniensis TaxID=51637 RepID=A0AA88KMK0_NAELO|nr:uncharacterized protein C9374_002320 [Naegleria lovaniensis]KAG2386576.1 hypothetical protein C9374_002320 [Naegleria lovaniensis]
MLFNDKTQLEQQPNSFVPISLILIEESDNQSSPTVVAHAKLIQSQQSTFIIETVVTRKDKRGSGLGRRVMDELCSYAKTHLPQGSTLYLSTKIPTFYEKCGFERCEAPESFGKVCSSLNTQQIHSLSNMLAKRFPLQPPPSSQGATTTSSETTSDVWLKKIIHS